MALRYCVHETDSDENRSSNLSPMYILQRNGLSLREVSIGDDCNLLKCWKESFTVKHTDICHTMKITFFKQRVVKITKQKLMLCLKLDIYFKSYH